jgi:hypothetical protein
LSSQNGTWNETGRHYAWVDHYTMWCPYNFCGGYVYDGSYTFSAGANTGADWAVIPMTIGRYSTASLSDGDADSILSSASSILQSNDGGGDVACRLSFDRNGTVSSFTVGDGVIDDGTEASAIHAVSPRVKVVNQILWCGGPGAPGTIIGCTSGSSSIITRTTSSLEPQLWAHEYGHTQALLDNTTTPGMVMYQTASASNTRVTSYDCNAMTHPINSR